MFRRIVVGSLVSLAFSGLGCGYLAPFDAPLPSGAGAGGIGTIAKNASSSGAGAGQARASGGAVSSSQSNNVDRGGATLTSSGDAWVTSGGTAQTTSAFGGAGLALPDGTTQGGPATSETTSVVSTSLGGITASGGATQVGGVTSFGGTTSAGGQVVTGGNASSGGGAVTVGGSVATGGHRTTGGAETDGSRATGGAATGGAATGGAATGGAATGGSAVQEPPSCRALATKCGSENESCCTTIKVPGGMFKMGRSAVEGASDYYANGNANELPEHDATVDDFVLDKYEVTVGRFREFVKKYDEWRAAGNPKDNAGMHPRALNSGWGRSWPSASSDLPADSTLLEFWLKGDGAYVTWTDDVQGNESFPADHVTWHLGLAFCIWDGGRLPTEAEWEYAAAGGDRNTLYPWGNDSPDTSRANFYDSDDSPYIRVGSKGERGAGRWGHRDLAGSMHEWVFDWYSPSYYGSIQSPKTCTNCANADIVSSPDQTRGIRGGSWSGYTQYLRGAYRSSLVPDRGSWAIGVRCARDH